MMSWPKNAMTRSAKMRNGIAACASTRPMIASSANPPR